MAEDFTNTTAAGNQAVDAFQALARIYLTSAERLSALNIGAAREAIEDQSALTRAMLGIRSPGEAGDVQSGLAQPMIDKALAYSRNTYEILAQTQAELSRVILSQWSNMGARVPLPVDWNAAFELFRSSARQFSDMAAQSMTKAADTAAAAGAEMKKTA